MKIFERLDERYGNSELWEFIKFNLVGYSISFLQLFLANILPFFFDGVKATLPVFLRGIFDPKVLFAGESPYVIDGVVTWGYVLPFFLSNFLGNIYGYFVNMKVTFKQCGSRKGMITYLVILFILILVSTWMQGLIASWFAQGKLAPFARTIAAWAAGLFQFIVLYPLEKFIIFKEK